MTQLKWTREVGSVIGWVCREWHISDSTGDERYYTIRSKSVPATRKQDVCLPILAETDNRMNYPSCPDCGGEILWAEGGGVPGSRECEDCGSRFADSRYHAIQLNF